MAEAIDNPVATEQPDPKPGVENVPDRLIARLTHLGLSDLAVDCRARAEMGKRKRGTYLMTHNGRDADWDFYQELIDAAKYAEQKFMESGDPADEAILLETIALAEKGRKRVRRK